MDSCVDRSTAISTRVRLFRLFLLIPCWESQRLIPKRSAGPRATKIGVVSLKALDHHRPNREEFAILPLNYRPPDRTVARRSSLSKYRRTYESRANGDSGDSRSRRSPVRPADRRRRSARASQTKPLGLRQTSAGRKPIQPTHGSAIMGMAATLSATAATKRRASLTRSRSDGGGGQTRRRKSLSTLVSRRVLSKKSTTFLGSCSTGMAHQARDCERSRAPSDRRSPRAGPCRSRVPREFSTANSALGPSTMASTGQAS